MVKLSDGTEFRIKWKDGKIPYIEFYNNGAERSQTVVLSNKMDVRKIANELTDFIKFYQEDFALPHEAGNEDD